MYSIQTYKHTGINKLYINEYWPVCHNMWLVKCSFLVNDFPHRSHLNGVSFVCDLIWFTKCSFLVYFLPHIWQWCGVSPIFVGQKIIYYNQWCNCSHHLHRYCDAVSSFRCATCRVRKKKVESLNCFLLSAPLVPTFLLGAGLVVPNQLMFVCVYLENIWNKKRSITSQYYGRRTHFI